MQNNVFRKSLVVGIIILFLGASVIPSIGSSIIIKHDLQGDKTTFKDINSRGYIQDLIDNASDGDTIYIPSGTYYEKNIIINKSISLVGENKDTTIIDGEGSTGATIVIVNANWVNISGFAIRNSGTEWNDAGIKILSKYTTISGNNISNNFVGIYLDFSSNGNNITSNNISNKWYGIYLEESSNNNTITGNNISNNYHYGITLDDNNKNNTISGNTIISSDYGIYFLPTSYDNIIAYNSFFNTGLAISDACYNIVKNNTVNGEPLVYLYNETDLLLGVDAGQIILVYCTNITVENQEISNTSKGIQIWESNNCIISGNTITNNKGAGIDLHGDNNTISDNTITSNNFDGIDLIGYNNTISGNIITHNWWSIFLSGAGNNIIYGNTITDNVNGVILFVGSDINLIIDNTIKNIQYTGISLDSHSNIIFGNTITNNNEGIYLHGDNNIISDNNIANNELFGIINWNNLFSNNTIYHNNFINNQINAIVSGNNTWDDGKYGNYWSDYKEKYPHARKLWLKGIWDTPYEIEEGDKKDNCPLIRQWSKSKSKTIIRNTASYSYYLLRLLERFPTLQKIIERVGLQ